MQQLEQAIKSEKLQQSYILLLQSNAPNSYQIQASRQIIEIMKIYKEDNNKHIGELYNQLHEKLDIFYDFFGKIGL